jgi:hypothetical protein
MNAKHTPGPWHNNSAIVYAADGFAVANASTYHGKRESDTLPNARLIAAAPDLLAACEGIRACITVPGLNGETVLSAPMETLMAVCDAIAKARGE